jgi:hypothetical protein
MIRNYYISIAIAALLGIAACAVPANMITLCPDVVTNLERISMILLLASIPLALKLFQKKTEMISPDISEEEHYNIALHWANVRIWIVASALYVNEALFAVTKNSSMIFCCLIAAIVLVFFCRYKKR